DAERPFEVEERGRPNRALTIFDELADNASTQAVISGERGAFPAREPVLGTDPKRAVASRQKATNVGRRERLAGRWLPGHGLHAVEAKHAGVRTEPEVSVRRLGNGKDRAFEKAVADPPCRVGVLTDVERRIQCERTVRAAQHDGETDDRSSGSC